MPHVRTPLQHRSRETLERILETAAAAADDGSFGELSIREICKRSRVTTGAYYARFRKKDDLAFALFESLGAEFRALIDDHVTQRQVDGLGVAVHTLLSGTAALYRNRAGLLHALMSKAGASRDLATAMRAFNDEMVARLVAPPFANEVRHPEPALGLRLGYVCVFTTLKEIVLDQHLFNDSAEVEDGPLVDELTRMFLGYVTDGAR